jgi:hypothetical protein
MSIISFAFLGGVQVICTDMGALIHIHKNGD